MKIIMMMLIDNRRPGGGEQACPAGEGGAWQLHPGGQGVGGAEGGAADNSRPYRRPLTIFSYVLMFC